MVKSRTRREIMWRQELAGSVGAHVSLETLGLSWDDPDIQFILSAFMRSGAAGRDILDPTEQAECIDRGRRGHQAAKDRDAACVVYYLAVNQYIKIGTANDLRARLDAYPPGTRLLATEPGSYTLESARLLEFREYLAARREWFRPGPRLIEHINRLRQGKVAEVA